MRGGKHSATCIRTAIAIAARNPTAKMSPTTSQRTAAAGSSVLVLPRRKLFMAKLVAHVVGEVAYASAAGGGRGRPVC